MHSCNRTCSNSSLKPRPKSVGTTRYAKEAKTVEGKIIIDTESTYLCPHLSDDQLSNLPSNEYSMINNTNTNHSNKHNKTTNNKNINNQGNSINSYVASILNENGKTKKGALDKVKSQQWNKIHDSSEISIKGEYSKEYLNLLGDSCYDNVGYLKSISDIDYAGSPAGTVKSCADLQLISYDHGERYYVERRRGEGSRGSVRYYAPYNAGGSSRMVTPWHLVIFVLFFVLFVVVGIQLSVIYAYGGRVMSSGKGGGHGGSPSTNGDSESVNRLLGAMGSDGFLSRWPPLAGGVIGDLGGPIHYRHAFQPQPPPPRVNFKSLLTRNVPTIPDNLARVRAQASALELNRRLIERRGIERELRVADESLLKKRSNEDRRNNVKDSGITGAQSTKNLRDQNHIGSIGLLNFGAHGNLATPSATMINIPKPRNSTGSLATTPQTKVNQGLDYISYCAESPDGLQGRIFADTNHSHFDNYSVETIQSSAPDIEPGGTWRPANCTPRHRVAIIIPYRDRHEHLSVLLGHLHPILHRQLLYYKIFVVEQFGRNSFNKARIMNIAFLHAFIQDTRFDCFIFHDVDLIPEDDRNMYSCPEQPRHMSPAIDEMNYVNPYEELVGGVLAIRTNDFFRVNGYSNLYWGWGAEDDDMAYRIQHVGLKITRPPSQIARYKMIRHTKRPAVDRRLRYRLLFTGVRRYKIDGLNSLRTLNYTILYVKKRPLFEHIMVDVGKPPPGF